MIVVLYILTVFALSIYSFALVDPNITFLNHHLWVSFREVMVQFGYYRRDLSWYTYLILVSIMFVLHYLLVTKKHGTSSAFRTALIIGCITVFSYPFLTHDFFNYLFDAKILTFYHQNPYLHRAFDFPHDPWLRFMHWTTRTYPYGPTFLLLSIIPSFLSMGKFVVDYLLFKLLFVSFYLVAVKLLSKMNSRWAWIFATHPLIIIEGLVNSHNDLIAVSLGIIGIYYMLHARSIWTARFWYLISAGIKYTTAPLIVVGKSAKNNYLVLIGIVALLGYLSYKSEIQPWYFMTLFVLIPLHTVSIEKVNLFLAGLLYSYYPYIRLGGWDRRFKVDMKHQIIVVFFVINVIVYFIQAYRERKDRKRSS